MRGLLVGYGSIGRRHLSNFHDLGVQEWSIVHTGRGTLPLEPPCPAATYTDLGDALRLEAPDFAVVANPTSMHVETALACIDAGCHLLLEKPVSHTLEGLDVLAAAAAKARTEIVVGFQFRFHPALARIRELLLASTIGSPLHARAVWGEYLPSWHPWEDWRQSHASKPELGGGALHISHPLDYLRMLFGDAVGVSAVLRSNGPLQLEVPESADAILRFEHDVVAHVHLDYWTRPTANRLEIACTEGSIYWDYMTGEFRWWDTASEAWHAEVFPGVEARNDLFVSEARHVLDVIAGSERPVCTLEDGIRSVRLCAAIEESAATGAFVEIGE